MKSQRDAEMKGTAAPLGGDRLAVMANTVEQERAGRGQDGQEGPVLGSLLSWGRARGWGKENTTGSWMDNCSLERQLGDVLHPYRRGANLGPSSNA